MKFKSQCLAISAAMLMAAPQAHAVLVILGASVADNTYLDAGTHAGSFDWSGVLLPNLQINSASYSFIFTDNTDALTAGTRVLTGTQDTSFALTYSSGGGGSDWYGTYRRDHTDIYTRTDVGAGEGAAVTWGSASTAAGSGTTPTTTSTQSSRTTLTNVSSSFSGTAGYSYTYSCGRWPANSTCSGYVPGSYTDYQTANYVTETVTVNDQTGTFTVSGSITGPALLAELRANQGLSFSLGILGDLLLSSGRLALDVSSVPGVPVSAVPEPSTFALLLGGFCLIGGVARHRRRATTACTSLARTNSFA